MEVWAVGRTSHVGGDSVLVLLQGVLNFIAESEAVPNVLKAGIVVPVYKGGGKDPLKVDSFWH